MQSYSFPHHLSNSDILRNHQLVENARSVISSQLELDLEEDGSFTGFYAGFFLAVSFSDLHPLMVVTLSRPFTFRADINTYRALNRTNLSNILGSHIINNDVGCYSFRATQWLFSAMTGAEFRLFLSRCQYDAEKGYANTLPSYIHQSGGPS